MSQVPNFVCLFNLFSDSKADYLYKLLKFIDWSPVYPFRKYGTSRTGYPTQSVFKVLFVQKVFNQLNFHNFGEWLSNFHFSQLQVRLLPLFHILLLLNTHHIHSVSCILMLHVALSLVLLITEKVILSIAS